MRDGAYISAARLCFEDDRVMERVLGIKSGRTRGHNSDQNKARKAKTTRHPTANPVACGTREHGVRLRSPLVLPLCRGYSSEPSTRIDRLCWIGGPRGRARTGIRGFSSLRFVVHVTVHQSVLRVFLDPGSERPGVRIKRSRPTSDADSRAARKLALRMVLCNLSSTWR